ncbi:MAG: hypothetical protein GVY35_08560 [Bacteroidetes bacterium]|jgi:putative ABC transport system permease protein|nr:hypothetical protein [Bacteroidota bacterium]
MLRSYLTLAARTLRRRLGYTAVNTLGLTVGLACCALVAIFLQYELTYDAHHDDADRIYRLISGQPGDEDFSTIIFGRGNASGDAQRAYAEQLVAEIPEIEQATNYVILDDPALYEVTAALSYGYNVLVRLVPGRIDDGLQAIRAAWPDVQPDTPLRMTFLDEDVAQLYEQEARFTTLSGVLASIVALLNKEHVQIVGIAFLVGAPLAWWAAEAWLGQFAYQLGVSPLVFVGAGLGALTVAILAVSTQALRAARVDPATVLRSE